MRHPVTRVDVQVRPNLTAYDVEALRLIAGGVTNQVVAQHFGVSTATTGRRLSELFASLGARDRTHAVAIALTAGVIHASDVQLPAWVQAELVTTARTGCDCDCDCD